MGGMIALKKMCGELDDGSLNLYSCEMASGGVCVHIW